MKQIILMGASLNSGNRGVNALTRGTINALIDANEDCSITIISYTVKQKIENVIDYHNKILKVNEIPSNLKGGLSFYIKTKFSIDTCFLNRDVYKLLENADIVLDISEGDSFSDIYGYKRFFLHSFLKLGTIKLGKKLILLPQTMGPYNNKFVKLIARKILNSCYFIYTRDKISQNYLINDLKIKKKVEYIPDLAFYMEPNKNISINKYINGLAAGSKLIGINISGLLINGGYTKNNMFNFKCDYKELVNEIITYFLKERENNILLVPHVFVGENEIEDDLTACNTLYNELINKFKGRLFIVNERLREDECKAIIGQCDFFIGGRMHACIAALSSNVPVVPIAYSRKFIGIWEAIGLKEFVADPRKQNVKEIIDIISYAFNGRDSIMEKLKKYNSETKQKITDMFNSILSI